MTFKPLHKNDVYIDQDYNCAIRVLEDNNIQWLYQSDIFNKKHNKSRQFDIGFFKDFGLIEIHCVENKVSVINLHLNWYSDNQQFGGTSFSLNAHYSFPNGQGEEYRACSLNTNSLFTAIDEIQSKGHTIFPFLSLNFVPPIDIFPNLYQQYLDPLINANNKKFETSTKYPTIDYFMSLLSNDHNNFLGDPLSERYKTNYNSIEYKKWNDLNAGNKKCLSVSIWNDVDQKFNIEVGNILRTYDESFYDDKNMDLITNFIQSPLFNHTMECGLNITHVIGIIKYQPLHDLIYKQFLELPHDEQYNLLNTSDQMGLTLPLLFIDSQLNHIGGYNYQQQLLLDRLELYSSLPSFKESLTTTKCSFLDIVNFNEKFYDILEVIEKSGYKIQDTMHVRHGLFSKYYSYDYQINGQQNIIEHLKNINNITILTSNKKDLAKFIHHYWLEQKTAAYMIDKQPTVKKIKI